MKTCFWFASIKILNNATYFIILTILIKLHHIRNYNKSNESYIIHKITKQNNFMKDSKKLINDDIYIIGNLNLKFTLNNNHITNFI